jgi:hypothetical protein
VVYFSCRFLPFIGDASGRIPALVLPELVHVVDGDVGGGENCCEEATLFVMQLTEPEKLAFGVRSGIINFV